MTCQASVWEDVIRINPVIDELNFHFFFYFDKGF